MKVSLGFINYYFLRFLFIRLAVSFKFDDYKNGNYDNNSWRLLVGLWPWTGYNGKKMNVLFEINFPLWIRNIINKFIKFTKFES